jgi:23S rRNA (cytosine1962-C5)-methyltransferase
VERHAVRVTADALRQIRSGHPWVFDRSIRSGPRDAAPGDLGVVFDPKRRFAAIGLWDPLSPIRLRILHHGSPTPIDDGFWRNRIDDAIGRRAPLWRSPNSGPAGPARRSGGRGNDTIDGSDGWGATTGWRAVHGENDRLPGLVADRYGSCLVVKLDTAALEPHLGPIVDALVVGLGAVGAAVEQVVVRSSRTVGAPPRMARGTRPGAPVRFRENGLALTADVWQGQKTGHFLDQRDNRALVGSLAAGADVLDVFCCTGGFSVNAAAGGARSVVSTDLSRWALAATERHLALNAERIGAVDHTTIRGDAFEVLAALSRQARRFDLVVVDPPSFAAKAADRDRAVAAYRRLAALAADLIRPGGRLFQASCSSRVDSGTFDRAVAAGMADAGRGWAPGERTGHAVDHPIGFPEGAYLKAVWGTVDGR